MRKNRIYIVSAAILLSLGIVYAATLAEHGSSNSTGSWVGKSFCLKSIGASDAEISDIKAIKLKYREKGIKIWARKDIAMLHLKTALVGGVSEANLKPLMAEVLKAKMALLANKVGCIRETSRVLKDEKVRKAYLEKAVECCLSHRKACAGKTAKSCDYKDKSDQV